MKFQIEKNEIKNEMIKQKKKSELTKKEIRINKKRNQN
jgi:hypothetical protein